MFFLIIASNVSFIEDPVWGQNLTPLKFGAMALGDIDNNGYLDIISTGCFSSSSNDCLDGVAAKIYTNNGTSFVENQTWENNLTGVGLSSVAWGDIDNDGDLDLALTGCDSSTNFNCNGNRFAKIYINNGTSLIESPQWQDNLEGVQRGNIAFGDINNDGKLDLVLSGYKESVTEVTKIYLNNGTALTESSQWQDNLISQGESSVLWGDYNNDGFLDLLTCGHTTGDYCYLYKNNGSTLLLNQTRDDGLPGIYSASIAFGDIDNDGDLDLVGMGWEYGRTKICENNETNNYYFQNDATAHLNISDDLFMGSLAFGDYDNDRDLDLVLFGYEYAQGLKARVYISNASLTKKNTLPTSPNNFTSSYSTVNNTLTLGWNNGSDNETPSTGLYYNLMVGNATQNNTIVSGVYGGNSGSNEGGGGGANGYFGNMMQRKNITLNLVLPEGDYYWYVQTIDTGLAKSDWSARQTITVGSDITPPNISSISSSVTTTTATITWATDEMANSTVHYGTTISTTSKSSDVSLTQSHSISLSILSASTLYYYNVSSCDDSGNCNTSQQGSFTTSAAGSGSVNTGGSGGSGSTATSFWTKTEVVNGANLSNGVEKELGTGQRIKFNVSGEEHYVGVVNVNTTLGKATINISSNPIQIILGIGEEAKVNLTNDKFYDIYVKLISILNNKTNLTIQAIHEEISGSNENVETNGTIVNNGNEKENQNANKLVIVLAIVVGAIILIFVGILIHLLMKRRKHMKKYIRMLNKKDKEKKK